MTDAEIAERFKRLECENRILKRVGAAALLGIASLLLVAARHPAPEPSASESQRIVLRDPATGDRAVLDGEGLSLLDNHGRTRIELRDSTTGPKQPQGVSGAWLKLYDDNGRPGVELTEEVPPADFLQGFAREQSSGNLVMLDYQGDSVTAANLGVGKASGLWLAKTHLGQSQAWPTADDVDVALSIDGGSAGMQVQEHNDQRIGLFARKGMPGLDLTDAAGFETQIGVSDLKYPSSGQSLRTSAASIVMMSDKKGHKVIWSAP
jgi:hypothetical protein